MTKQTKRKSLVVFHKNCPSGDGFGSAFAAWLALGDSAEYLAADYGDRLPDAKGRDVYILDLSFDQTDLEKIASQASSLTLLDHHLSAQRKLSCYKPACCGKIHFDMGSSGCALAWREFHPGKPLPKILEHVQDRDLWTWKMPDSKPYLSWLDAQPKTFEAWKAALEMGPGQEASALAIGEALGAQYDRQCREIAKLSSSIDIGGATGLMVNASGAFRSDVGSLLAQESGTFGLVWRVSEKGSVLCSLRSRPPYDVEAIATLFGGGGHPSAASFSLDPGALIELAAGRIELPSPANSHTAKPR
jgi:oligoribonuclease NrnB/cAMP/cGMP phosphodiesterase (DHH superfamily)